MSRSIIPKTLGILTKVFYTYGPNLVILTWKGDELSRRQASDNRTHRRTDEHTDRSMQRQYTKAKTGLRQKTVTTFVIQSFAEEVIYHTHIARIWIQRIQQLYPRFSILQYHT